MAFDQILSNSCKASTLYSFLFFINAQPKAHGVSDFLDHPHPRTMLGSGLYPAPFVVQGLTPSGELRDCHGRSPRNDTLRIFDAFVLATR